MDNNKYYIKYYFVYRNKKTGAGYQFDFMYLEENGKEIPFINIYLLHNFTNEHRHFIIKPNGILEAAHYEFKNTWQKKDKNIPRIEFIYPLNKIRQMAKGRINADFFDRQYFKNNIIVEPVYIYLILQAVNNYFGSNNNSIWDIFTIINCKNEDIAVSKKLKK